MTVVQAGEEEENRSGRKKWEPFLTSESAILHDFSGTQVQEQKQTNRAAWEAFEATITREHNEYHVRLPWAEEAIKLPNNKTLAYKRLCSTLGRLKETPQVLEQYEQNFAEQISKRILGEVSKRFTNQQNRVHNLTHRAILTPDKGSTKSSPVRVPP